MSAQSMTAKPGFCPAKARKRSVPPSMMASAPRAISRASGREKHLAVAVGDMAAGGHLDVVGMYPVEILTFGRHHLDRGNTAIELRFHHGARADDADLLQLLSREGGVDLGNGIEDGQRRDRHQFPDAEMAAHGGDGGGFGAGGPHASDQPGEDFGLLAGRPGQHVAAHFAHIGMADRDVGRGAGGNVTIDQAAIIEIGRGRSDAADQSNMHVKVPRRCWKIRLAASVSPSVAVIRMNATAPPNGQLFCWNWP